MSNIDAIKNSLSNIAGQHDVKRLFTERLDRGAITRDEDPITHFGVYFAPYDGNSKEVFIGHHKKADMWLFNGGHIEPGENAIETMLREMDEEWGVVVNQDIIGDPQMLTITTIDNPRQKCKKHYDIWYFIPMDKETFLPDPIKLLDPYYKIEWMSIDSAQKLITDLNTHKALELIQNKLNE